MKLNKLFAAAALAFAMTSISYAGGDHCKAPTQECLDKMTTNLQERGWIGIEMNYSNENGDVTVTIAKVIDGSPAAQAGLQAGDQLVALNGVALTEENEAKVKEIYSSMKPESQVTYQLARDGEKKEVAVTLAKLPEEVLTAWVGRHMMEHATVAKAQYP